MTQVLKGLPKLEAVGPDGLPAELLNIDHPAFTQCFPNSLANVWVTGNTPPPQLEICDHQGTPQKRKTELIATATEGFRSSPTQAKYQ